MPPKPSTTATGMFTPREQEQLSYAVQCLITDPTIDIKRFSTMAGMTEGSARNAWARLRGKLGFQIGKAGGSQLNTPQSSAKKRGSKDIAGSDSDEPATPTKKARTPAKKGDASRRKVKKESSDDEDVVKAEDVSDSDIGSSAGGDGGAVKAEDSDDY